MAKKPMAKKPTLKQMVKKNNSLNSMSVTELKVMAYDKSVILSQYAAKAKQVNEEIQIINQEITKKENGTNS